MCQAHDTIIITSGDVEDPILEGPAQLCNGQTGTIEVTNATEFDSFIWNTGETGSSINVSGPGTYSVTATVGGGCTNTESITIGSNGGLTTFMLDPLPALCGESSGSIDLTATPPQSLVYLWSNGASTPDLIDLASGNYSVTVTDENGCTITGSTFVADEQISIQIDGLVNPNTSCGDFNGSISLTVTPSTETYTILWSNGETTEEILGLSPGSYNVTVSTGLSCIQTATFVVDDSSDAAEIDASVVPSSCGEDNGAASVSMIGGQGPFTYEWSTGNNTNEITDLFAGTYTITVTGADGCESFETISVINEDFDIQVTGMVVPNTSCSSANGEIDLSVFPVEDYTYQWSNGSNAADQSNLSPGVYVVTVTLGNTCEGIASFNIDNNSDATEISAAVTPASCGENNGAIDITLNGGQGPFTYEWSSGQTSEDISEVSSGTYDVTITSADGCVSLNSIPVPNEDPVISITGNVIPNTSCDDSNGEIDITVSPPGLYSYAWSNGMDTEDLINLPAGAYFVTVSFGASCQQVASFTVTNQNIPFEITSALNLNTSCDLPNGSIDITVNPPDTYTYLWSDGSTSQDLTDLGEGDYIVTVTNAAGCSISSSFEVMDLVPSIYISALTIDNVSCEIPNGMIDISILPAGAYTYIWSDGSTTEDLQNIGAGNYGVTVTSLNGCVADTFFIIEDQSTSFSIYANTTPNTSCDIPNGSASIAITPAGTYTYQWSNGENSTSLTGLSHGTFTVTVTDANACSSTATISVIDSLDAPILSAVIIPDVCNTGVGAIDLMSGSSYVSIQWSNGASTEDLAGLNEGLYSVIVIDSNGCTATDSFVVNSISNNFSVEAIPYDNTSCVTSNGSIDLSVTPVGVYSVLWSSGETAEDISGLAAGNYYVTITDSSGCSSTTLVQINDVVEFPVIVESITPSTCGYDNGSIGLSVSPATGNSFAWSNGATVEDLQAITAGSYTVTVTSLNGCTAVASFIVPDNNSSFALNGSITDNNSCGNPNGSVAISVTPSGSYGYVWSNGSTLSDLSNVSAGAYDVTVTDTFGCTTVATFEVGDNTPSPQLLPVITPASCGKSNGAIDLEISGTPAANIVWSNGMTSEDLVNIVSGSYTVTVTSSNGCSSTITVEVPNENTNFTIEGQVTDIISCMVTTGAIDIQVIPPGIYAYEWSDGQSNEDVNNLEEGIYEVTVTDAFGCASIAIFAVENHTNLPLFSESLTPAMCGEASGRIDLTVPDSTQHSFLWSTGDLTEDLDDVMPGHYSVTVTDENGCTAFEDFDVIGSPFIALDIDADLSALAMDGTVQCSLQLSVSPGTLQSIVWTPDAMMSCHDPVCLYQTFTIAEQTEVVVAVTDTNGCRATASLMLDVELEPVVFIPNVFSPNNDGVNDRFTVYTNAQVEEVVILEIFDRWGNKVFVNENFLPNAADLGWDGAFKTHYMNPAVFAYRSVVRLLNGDERTFTGDVTLVK